MKFKGEELSEELRGIASQKKQTKKGKIDSIFQRRRKKSFVFLREK
jgi:hypothetical protein